MTAFRYKKNTVWVVFFYLFCFLFRYVRFILLKNKFLTRPQCLSIHLIRVFFEWIDIFVFYIFIYVQQSNPIQTREKRRPFIQIDRFGVNWLHFIQIIQLYNDNNILTLDPPTKSLLQFYWFSFSFSFLYWHEVLWVVDTGVQIVIHFMLLLLLELTRWIFNDISFGRERTAQ